MEPAIDAVQDEEGMWLHIPATDNPSNDPYGDGQDIWEGASLGELQDISNQGDRGDFWEVIHSL